jgi:pimeloyl-ACP methyl ester carboxylesterase
MTNFAASLPSSPAVLAPPLSLAWLEPFRAMGEFAALLAASPVLMTAKRGDGHSVLVLPGFSATDLSTTCLRAYLTYLGYRSEEWSLGRNLGYRMLGKEQARLRARVEEVAADSGQKISIIGWSLGGVMARQMAREHPELIRQVITLGAPFTGDPRATSIRGYYELASGERLDAPETRLAWEANRAAPTVPATSIYSKTDGITAWRNCLEEESETAENIEIFGSHMGLTVNPMALYAIADRLAQPEANWRRFASKSVA